MRRNCFRKFCLAGALIASLALSIPARASTDVDPIRERDNHRCQMIGRGAERHGGISANEARLLTKYHCARNPVSGIWYSDWFYAA